jgi:hypothetical protein
MLTSTRIAVVCCSLVGLGISRVGEESAAFPKLSQRGAAVVGALQISGSRHWQRVFQPKLGMPKSKFPFKSIVKR